MYDADLFRCWTLDWVGTGLLHKQLSIYILVAVDRVKVSLKRKNERKKKEEEKKGKKTNQNTNQNTRQKTILAFDLPYIHTCALALFVHAKLASATPPWRDASIHLEFVSGSAIDPSTTNRSTHAHMYILDGTGSERGCWEIEGGGGGGGTRCR